jgi:phosphoglycerate dehydrogenase-like enzyme
MSQVVWTQWDDLKVPAGFTALSPQDMPLENSDLSTITFYVPQYMGGKAALEYSRTMSSLKYLQVPNAGYDDAIEYLSPGVILCNARGVHDASTAELAMGLAITARRGFSDFHEAQRYGTWRHKRYPSFNDSNIAIIGAGSIATILQRYLAPYDVTVECFSRSGSNGSSKIADLDSKLGTFDIVFLVLPLNDESRHMFDARRLALMKDGALIVNVARGAIIDTKALIAELESGRLYAGLDVTDPEPLPEVHDLWRVKNCIISPHVGGDSTAFESRGKRLVEEQLQRLARGEELINIVARG